MTLTENMASPQRRALVSIVLPTFNRETSIAASLEALLAQTYGPLEVIVCDDASTDRTRAVLEKYADPRLKVIVRETNGGPAAARNTGVAAAGGQIVFFTDDDVLVPPDWIENALPYFSDEDVVGIEGRIVYVEEGFVPTWSDRIVENSGGGQFMTANAAYRRQALLECGLLDTTLGAFRDRELALRIQRFGHIEFVRSSVVVHRRDLYTISTFFAEARKIRWWVRLYKFHKDDDVVVRHIYMPRRLAAVLCPPLLLLRLGRVRAARPRDGLFIILMYPRLVYERLVLWRAAWKERVFIV